MDKDPFEILSDFSILDHETHSNLTGPISSFYLLFLDIATIGFIFSLIISGIQLLFIKNPTIKAQIKADLGFKSVLTIIIFSFTFFVNIIYMVSVDII